MAEIKMVRIDSRLIHGQVITKWVKQTYVNRIVIIDDKLSADDFMKEIYIMAAPSDMKVDVYSVEEAAEYWKSEELGEGRLFVLFKDVDTIYRSIKSGIPIDVIQIGGLGGDSNRIKIFGPISFDENDTRMLNDLDSIEGCNIYLHQVPDEPKMEFSKALSKYKLLKNG